MALPDQSTMQNRLLARLPDQEFRSIASMLEPIDLRQGFVVVEANKPIDHVYFLCSGIGSVITVSSGRHQPEAGMFGREGFSPTSAGVGGTISVHEVLMQVAGWGYRMSLDANLTALSRNPTFANLLARFIQTFASQISYTALSNVNCQIDTRLARWLLMSHDRVDGDEIALTHDFISLMLGVRRPSVTTALHVLEGRKFILSERGRITIRDRRGMEEFAGDAYGKPEEEYRRLIGDI
ncbi:Crp/Fnr family transcriptional regulator [Rhizobium sp. AC44/96]|uniref:Crp/Fnr family transcriptional regulator n=1 Tax=unclassified Rhizobium TaxID=2613769 RepID=UPI00080FF2D4|nr:MULTISPECIES: Crp/Fnr family transcriptional regulator [unclassified Rhizobium]MDM9623296.1 Crp/Fnr family transcriptional regulator [Rhizobium sp. S96]OCJ12846.1 Crp/Fnr family transcriptional regulator [Rhizobium sp. AC44/96]